MKKLKQNISRILVAVLVLTSFASCDEVGDTDAGGTSAEALAGDWYMNVTAPDAEVVSEHALFSTFNTAANDNTFWLDDHEAYNEFKVKATFSNDTFSATSAANTYNARTVTITAGKVEKNAATSKGGHTVDKISFKAEFSDEPGVIYSYEGHRRTGFLEDEY